MTSRERFHETLKFGRPDRVPLFLEGLRENVLKRWQIEGLEDPSRLYDLFLSDRSLEIDLEFDPLSYSSELPEEFSDIVKLDKKLNKLDLNKIWQRRKKDLIINADTDQVLFLKVHRGFLLDLGIHDWKGFTDSFVFMIENPDIVKRAMSLQCEIIAEYLEIVLRDIQVDAVIFNEPIGGNEGPLISPEMYENFALKYYKKIIEKVRCLGINNIIIRSYANIRKMIPFLLDYGLNTLWACESESGEMNYKNIRDEIGKDLRLIGGIDLDCLRFDKNRIKNEVETNVPVLLESGGYIPIADGRIRDNISFDNYIYYRRILEEVTGIRNLL